MDSAETAEDPEDAEAEEKLHFKTGSRRFPRRFKMLCSIWAARCSGVSSPSGEALALIQMSPADAPRPPPSKSDFSFTSLAPFKCPEIANHLRSCAADRRNPGSH